MEDFTLGKVLETSRATRRTPITIGIYKVVRFRQDDDTLYTSYVETEVDGLIHLSNTSETIEEAVLYCIAFKNLPLGQARAAAKEAAKILNVYKSEG